MTNLFNCFGRDSFVRGAVAGITLAASSSVLASSWSPVTLTSNGNAYYTKVNSSNREGTAVAVYAYPKARCQMEVVVLDVFFEDVEFSYTGETTLKMQWRVDRKTVWDSHEARFRAYFSSSDGAPMLVHSYRDYANSSFIEELSFGHELKVRVENLSEGGWLSTWRFPLRGSRQRIFETIDSCITAIGEDKSEEEEWSL